MYPMSKLIRCSIETDNQISAILVCRTTFIFAYVLALCGRMWAALVVVLPGTDAVDKTRTITITFWTAFTFAFTARGYRNCGLEHRVGR